MSNQWEINEWGSTLDLGWLPFEEIYVSMYFVSKDATNYFTAKTTTYYFITDDTDNYFTSKGEA